MSTEGSGQEWPQYGQAHGPAPSGQDPVQDPYGPDTSGSEINQWQAYDKAPTSESSFGPPQLPGPDSKDHSAAGGAALVAVGVILLIIVFAVLAG